jgi:hypothetical protein
MVTLFALPKHTTVLFYSARSKSTEQLIASVKGAYYTANGALCAAWMLATIVSKGSISDLNIEAEEIEVEEGEEQQQAEGQLADK